MTEDDVKRLVVIRDGIAGRTRFEDQRERADEFLLRLLDEERAERQLRPIDDAARSGAPVWAWGPRMRRVAQTLHGAGINAVITCERLPELIELYLAGARKAARAAGRRAAIEECAGLRDALRRLVEERPDVTPTTWDIAQRALADQPAPGMPRAGDD